MTPSAQDETHCFLLRQSFIAAFHHTCWQLVKVLVVLQDNSTETIQWGTQKEDDTQKQYLEYLQSSGYSAVSMEELGLVINNDSSSLACSPDGLVNNLREEQRCC